ncbi:hypothetical protein NKH63_28640 [Mesorhizobium sp. M0960]|uniref:hypothetical protein n=1 Tax=Mesorhizobium sp. M0960 TaxID=2957035 RepID=UPI00333DFCA3
MSVLSRPQGSPERVWSLIAGLAALGGRANRETLEGLFNPGYVKAGVHLRTKEELAGDSLGAAVSLGLLETDRHDAWLDAAAMASDFDSFADQVHDRLTELESGHTDAVILEAYAWIFAESDRQRGLGWIYDWGRDEFADKANDALLGEDEEGRPMNTTKIVAWRRWLSFLGLGIPLPLPNVPDYPSPAARITRELERGRFAADGELSADKFLSLISERQPYLDRGRLYLQACQRIGHVPKSRMLSPLLSMALRDLHDDRTIQLRIRGDAADAVALSDDPAHPVQSFNLVAFRNSGPQS